jgi:cation-transporting ATPase 13A1
VKAGEDVSDQIDNSDDPLAEFWSFWSKPFKPNLFNTVVFLVQTSQSIGVLLVNYKGRPWMKGVLENHPLCLSLFMCVGGVALCAWSIYPELNALIHLTPFPNDEFRWKVMTLVMLSIFGTFMWDRLVTMIFAPSIFKAMMDAFLSTRPNDLLPMFVTAGKGVGVLMLLGSGNIFLWGAAFFWWRRRKSSQK